MAFEQEKIGPTGPTAMVEAHQLVVDWLTENPRSGYVSYLTHRHCDMQNQCALYSIMGIGRGEGERFALVYRRDLVIFDLAIGGGPDGPMLATPEVYDISVFEGSKLPRSQVEQLIRAAMKASGHADVSMQRTRWRVIPRKSSRLYWTEKAKTWWQRNSYGIKKFFRTSWDVLTSPLMATLTCILFYRRDIAVPSWALAVSGLWLAIRWYQYDEDYFAGRWFVGVRKLKHGMQAVLRMQSRLMNPRPLAALQVKVQRASPGQTFCMVSLTNTTFLPVPYVSIGAHGIADMVAPGFTGALRAQNNGAINAEDLDKVYGALQKSWLLPRQTVQWQVPLLKDYPMKQLPREVSAIVSISHFISGEEKRAPTSFLLPVALVS
jgi:hypothetical protein